MPITITQFRITIAWVPDSEADRALLGVISALRVSIGVKKWPSRTSETFDALTPPTHATSQSCNANATPVNGRQRTTTPVDTYLGLGVEEINELFEPGISIVKVQNTLKSELKLTPLTENKTVSFGRSVVVSKNLGLGAD